MKLLLTLSRTTSVILLGDPFSGLDPMVRESIVQGLLCYLVFSNQIIMISTHELDEIEEFVGEAILIQDGRNTDQINVETLREEQGLTMLQWLEQNAVKGDE
ncbi:hypothetical protein [Jeotgalibacillus soli]|uniref:ABC transporter ATP-binding protein n=1 Tax=Jeotgalibacillus soli TaxID=889306 RepID=A0A0C2RS00_9BACL|nr:hypothetical protein [Jeotgalibacillus soli]KIL44509.1 hypothetical protein KP78_34730 [Jeotgalibacillus soli]